MKLFYKLVMIIISGTLILGAGCLTYGNPTEVKIPPPAITLMISSNTSSNFTPCGCHSGKWGGVPRRGSIFASMEALVDWPVLFIDTGDVAQGSQSEIQQKKDTYIFQAYDVMDYDVVNVGYSDLNFTPEQLHQIGDEYDIPWTSANIYPANIFPDLPIIPPASLQPSLNDAIDNPDGSVTRDVDPSETTTGDSGNPASTTNPSGTTAPAIPIEDMPDTLFEPYRIIEMEGYRGFKIGFIGMMMQDAGRLNPKSDKFSFEPYIDAINRTVNVLRTVEQVDLVILVCDQDTFDNIDTEAVFADVDLVIGGCSQLPQSPNASLNELNPLFRPPPDVQYEMPPLEEEESVNGEEVVDGGPDYEPIPLPLVSKKGAGRARLILRLDLYFDESGQIYDYYSTEIRVDDTWEDDPRLAEVINGYDTNVHAVEVMARVDRNFAGSQSCDECHPGYLAAWSNHGHFHAYETILNQPTLANKSCTRCHAAGFVDEEQYLLPYELIPETHRDIGCEGCHQGGARHITNQNYLAGLSPDMMSNMTAPDAMETEITVAICMECHTGDWAIGFDFDASMASARDLCQNVVPPPPSPEDVPADANGDGVPD
jgi:hypothetical protein